MDALWNTKLKPALLARWPGAMPRAIKKAQGYAYGGAIIQDLGYYPQGTKQFSEHFVTLTASVFKILFKDFLVP